MVFPSVGAQAPHRPSEREVPVSPTAPLAVRPGHPAPRANEAPAAPPQAGGELNRRRNGGGDVSHRLRSLCLGQRGCGAEPHLVIEYANPILRLPVTQDTRVGYHRLDLADVANEADISGE